MNINSERQCAPEIAMQIAEATIKEFNLKVEFCAYGEEFKTYHCKLIDPQNNTLFYGCGKGIGIQSKVSACFEALEHYAVHAFCQLDKNTKLYDSLDKPFIVNPLKKYNLLDPQIYQSKEKIPFTRCLEIITGEELYYPLYMLDPRYAKNPAAADKFDYKPYAWNACDSGIASGTSKFEASIHALNEAVERDAYSLFLIQAFLLNNSINIIDKQSVPGHLQTIIRHIEKKYNEELILVDITSDIGIPTILVSMTQQAMTIQPIGCGTSLFKDYAMERALLESLQPLHLFNKHLSRNQDQIVSNFSKAPLLARCAKADITQLIQNAHTVSFDSLLEYKGSISLEKQLLTIIERISNKGFSIYTATIAEINTGFHCVKFIIPGFEQFYLVEIGKFILPNKRGMELIKANYSEKSESIFLETIEK
jgi:ribosomal protein S12 methylthiotransferase accessory factor